MQINIINQKKEIVSNFPLDKFWEETYSPWAVNLAHRHYLANQRQGTNKVKNRGEVEGSTRKIWKQKGTGRARHGSRYAPQFRGGGIAFGPSGNKNYSLQINKKVKKRAFQSVLSKKIENHEVMIIKEIKFNDYKTKEANNFLRQLEIERKKTLVVFSQEEGNDNKLRRAFQNLPQILITNSKLINTYQVLISPQILFTSEAFTEIEKRLKNNA